MPKTKLTDEVVRKLKPTPGKQIIHFDKDEKRLTLTVNPGGSKTWSVLHYVDGKPRYHKLGRYSDALRPAEARAQAKAYLVALDDAKRELDKELAKVKEKARRFSKNPREFLQDTQQDPETFVAELVAAQEKALAFLRNPHKLLRDESFEDVAENFVKQHVEKNQLRSQYEIVRCLKRYVYPKWGKRPFRDIQRGDVNKLLESIEDENGARQADVVLTIVSKLMRWFQARNNDYVSPIVPGMKRSQASSRARILDDEEIRAVWNAADGTFGGILKVLLLTAQRLDKVRTMKFEDIKDGVWTIPSAPREKANAGTLVLPQSVLDVIEAQPRIAGNPYVFAASKLGRGAKPVPYATQSDGKAALDKKLKGMPHWVLHDLRRTAKSLMARAGVRRDISERVLGHIIEGVEGIYDRHSYRDEKGQALEALASLVERILNPPADNVTDLAEHRERAASA